MNEQVIHFGQDNSLVGIVTPAEGGATGPRQRAIIFLNAGVLHRVGPNRLHVAMARELAAKGLLCCRIDHSGIGDSPAHTGSLPIPERWVAETREAMDCLTEKYGIKEFMLFGSCSGAAVAWLTSVEDPRVSGTALINLQGPKIYLRYYLRLALTSSVFWRRLRKGKARYRDAMDEVRQSGERRGDAQQVESPAAEGFDIDHAIDVFARRGTRLLLVYCGWDPGLDHFNIVLRPRLEARIRADRLAIHMVPAMNHDFTLLSGQAKLRSAVQSWVAAAMAPP